MTLLLTTERCGIFLQHLRTWKLRDTSFCKIRRLISSFFMSMSYNLRDNNEILEKIYLTTCGMAWSFNSIDIMIIFPIVCKIKFCQHIMVWCFFLQGEVLFNSWKDLFAGSGAPFSYPPRIYSFDGRNVLTDNTWWVTILHPIYRRCKL